MRVYQFARAERVKLQLNNGDAVFESVQMIRCLEAPFPLASEQQGLSLFEPHTRAIPRHKGGGLVEFGRHVILDEVERQTLERSRIWRRSYRRRAGIEGRIASLRRDFGWRTSAYHGPDGMERWLGLGVIESLLRRIVLARESQPPMRRKRIACHEPSFQGCLSISQCILVLAHMRGVFKGRAMPETQPSRD